MNNLEGKIVTIYGKPYEFVEYEGDDDCGDCDLDRPDDGLDNPGEPVCKLVYAPARYTILCTYI